MSRVTDCFLLDPIGGSMALYDAESSPTYVATRYGVEQRQTDRVQIPLFEFTDVEVHDRCMILLLEAIKESGWLPRRAFEDADRVFAQRGLHTFCVLTSADHHLIPPGRRIAVAEPEYVGRIVDASGQRGRGVVLFNPQTVLGYKDPGRTSYEHLLGTTCRAWSTLDRDGLGFDTPYYCDI